MLGAYDVPLPEPSPRTILEIVFAYFFCVAANEAGYVLAALPTGFRIIGLGLWPVKLYRSEDSWRIEWMRKMWAPYVLPAPIGAENLRMRLFLLIAAGPGVSILLAVVAGLLGYRPNPGSPEWLVVQFKCIAWLSALLGVGGLVPGSRRLAVGTGRRLWMLLRGGGEVERYSSIMLLCASSANGIRPRDWSRELVDRASAPSEDTADAVTGQKCRYYWLLDGNRIEDAGRVLEWLLARKHLPQAQALWRLEGAWFEARFGRNLPAAQALLANGTKRDRRPEYLCVLYKAQAAIALLEQRWTEAESAAREALRLRKRLDPGLVAMLVVRDELDGLIRDAQAHRAF